MSTLCSAGIRPCHPFVENNLTKAQVVWVFPLANKSVRCNPLLVLKVHLGVKGVWLGLCLPYYLMIPFRFLSYMFILKKLLLELGSVWLLRWPLVLFVPLYSLPLFLSYPNSPVPVPPVSLLLYTLSPLPWETRPRRSSPHPVPYSMPNLCGYTDIPIEGLKANTYT